MTKKTKAWALLDRKTGKVVWVGLGKPGKSRFSGAWMNPNRYETIAHPRTFNTLKETDSLLTRVTITLKDEEPKPITITKSDVQKMIDEIKAL